jgi:ABC-type polysaccharide/polyol phosphate transport system ATPase subunit
MDSPVMTDPLKRDSVDDSSSRPAVVVEGLSKTFQLPEHQINTLKERVLHPVRHIGSSDFTALHDVAFDVREGEFFGIVGRNGSGKSTLLKCLAGIYRPNQGTIRMRGRVSTFIELGVGFNMDLAARDNMVINAIMLGLSPAEARRRFDQVIEFAELEEFVNLKLKNYSSGMLVRLAFSVAIQVDADILLIDEVLAVGDASFQQKCFEVFQQMKDEGRTILFVTHDMGAVARFCDRAMLLERGVVKIIDAPDRVGSHYLEINFGRDTAELGRPDEPERYGDGAARIVDAWFEDPDGQRTAHLAQGVRASFVMRIAFATHFPEPVPAVLLEDEQHRPLFATSTYDAGLSTGLNDAGDEALVRVSFDNVFAPGRIFASPWILHPGGAALADRRPRMTSVVITSIRRSGGIVDLPHEVSYERSTAGRAAGVS